MSDVVPLVSARVRGLSIGHSAHVSKAGYVPYVPVAADHGSERTLFVLWLDATQTVCINDTEPNYHPTVIPGEDFPLTLESGEALDRYSLYRGRWGALMLAPGGPALLATRQDEVYRKLARLAWFEYLVPESPQGVDATLRALSADERRRFAIREGFEREGLTTDDRLPQYNRRPIPYRELS